MLATILIYVIIALVAANMLLGWIILRRQTRLVALRAEHGFSTGTEDIERPCEARRNPDPGQRRRGALKEFLAENVDSFLILFAALIWFVALMYALYIGEPWPNLIDL